VRLATFGIYVEPEFHRSNGTLRGGRIKAVRSENVCVRLTPKFSCERF
jgi:hypothetical protein